MIIINNIEFLYKYLVKHLIDNQVYSKEIAHKRAKQMIKSKKDNLIGYHELAWWLGQYSFEYFCMYFLDNVFNNEETADLAQIHKEIWSDIQNIILDENAHDQQGYILPRGTGKSAFGGLATSLWTVCYNYKKYVLVCSSIGSTAEKFIKQMRIALEDNKRIEKAFGKIYDKGNKKYSNNNTQIEFVNRTMIEAISSTSPMRGRKNAVGDRPDLVILDDYQSDDDVRTDSARENKIKRYSDDVKYAKQRPIYNKNGTLKKRGTTMIALGTLQHKEDFYARLMKLPTWKFRHEKGVLVEDIDDLFNSGLWEEFYRILKDKGQGLQFAKEFYYGHEQEMKYPLLWSEFWNCLELALDYYENPASFKQEVQGDLDSIGERKFKSIVTESEEIIETHSFTKTLLAIDPAGTRNKSKKKDYFAFAVASQGSNSIKYIRKGQVFKFEYEDYINHTLSLLEEYQDITHLVIEKNTYSGADVIRLEELISKDSSLRYRNIKIINYHQTRNKDDKIDTIVGQVNLGQIVFNEEDTEAIEQLHEFCGCEYSLHDDFPDVVAEASKWLDEIEVIKPIKLLDRKLLGL